MTTSSSIRPPILVTGGAGFIGSHTCKALAQAGFLPVTYDSLCAGHAWAVKWGPLEEGDVRDRARLDQVFATWRPEAVIHLAASSNIPEAEADPEDCDRVNVEGTRRLLAAMAAHDCPHMVYSSSASVYGTPVEQPIPETAAIAPISAYGRSKAKAEAVLAEAAPAIGSVALRYFNAAGADPGAEIGEAHEPETHLLPRLLEVALGLRPAIQLFGTDYLTPDGTAIRDYIHVADLASGHLAALASLRAGAGGYRAYNLGTGQGTSVRELVAGVRAVTGAALREEIGPRRAGDPPVLVADPARAMTELGWRPAWTDCDDIIRHAWAWARFYRAELRPAATMETA